MDCKFIKDNGLLTEYADNVLKKEDAKRVAEHIASCETCKEELRGVKDVLEVIKKDAAFEAAAPSKEEFEAMTANVRGAVFGQGNAAHVKKIEQKSAANYWVRSIIPVAAAIMLVTTFTFVMFRNDGGNTSVSIDANVYPGDKVIALELPAADIARYIDNYGSSSDVYEELAYLKEADLEAFYKKLSTLPPMVN